MKCSFIIVLWDETAFFIVPCKKNATDKEISNAVAECFLDLLNDRPFFNSSQRRIPDRKASREIVQYAIENDCRFWKFEPRNGNANHFSFFEGEEESFRSEIRNTWESVLPKARRALGWRELKD